MFLLCIINFEYKYVIKYFFNIWYIDDFSLKVFFFGLGLMVFYFIDFFYKIK